MLQAPARMAAKVVARSREGVVLKDFKVSVRVQRPLVDAVRVYVISCDASTWLTLSIVLVTRERMRLGLLRVFALP